MPSPVTCGPRPVTRARRASQGPRERPARLAGRRQPGSGRWTGFCVLWPAFLEMGRCCGRRRGTRSLTLSRKAQTELPLKQPQSYTPWSTHPLQSLKRWNCLLQSRTGNKQEPAQQRKWGGSLQSSAISEENTDFPGECYLVTHPPEAPTGFPRTPHHCPRSDLSRDLENEKGGSVAAPR